MVYPVETRVLEFWWDILAVHFINNCERVRYIDDHHFGNFKFAMRILCKCDESYYGMSIWKSYPYDRGKDIAVYHRRSKARSSRGASIRHEHGFHLANHNNIRRYVQTTVSTDRQTRTTPASSLRVQGMGLARELALVLV